MNPTKLLLFGAVAATLATGCYSRRVVVHERSGAAPTVVTREVVVPEAPPPARVEVVESSPRSNSAWIPGYWRRSGSRWEWEKGHWQTTPQGYKTYMPGHWEQRGGQWVYYEGYWR